MNLAELITTHKGDRSYEALSDACGGSPRAARLQQLATKPQKNFPDPPTVEALALGLRVTPATVVLAAAESLGIDVRRATPALLDRMPAGIEELNEEQVRTIVDLARTFVRLNEATVLQKVVIHNLLLDSGVTFKNAAREKVVPYVVMDELIDLIIAEEHRKPGFANDFFATLSEWVDHISDHPEGRHEITVTVDPDLPPSEFLQARHLDEPQDPFSETGARDLTRGGSGQTTDDVSPVEP